jgi:hypothetical protein
VCCYLFRHFFLGGGGSVCILNSAWRNEMRFLRIYIIRYLTNSKLVIAFLGRLANADVCHCALLSVMALDVLNRVCVIT